MLFPLPRFQLPPFRVYLAAFVGGRRFSSIHSSLKDFCESSSAGCAATGDSLTNGVKG